MNRWVKNTARFLVVTVGALAITTLSIDATDMLQGSQSALSFLAERAATGSCPEEMVRVDGPDGPFCIDRFEASVGVGCPVAAPRIITETAQNVNHAACTPASVADEMPWTSVAVHQARALCAKAGKRLARPTEWYAAALGTPDTGTSCNVRGSLEPTGATPACVSGAGAVDLIGNVWELVDAEVREGTLNGADLPVGGYVASVDAAGLATLTTSTPQVVYNDDYFWARASGTFAVMRGGFHGSGADAGVYSTHAEIDPNFSSAAIGFRCARSL